MPLVCYCYLFSVIETKDKSPIIFHKRFINPFQSVTHSYSFIFRGFSLKKWSEDPELDKIESTFVSSLLENIESNWTSYWHQTRLIRIGINILKIIFEYYSDKELKLLNEEPYAKFSYNYACRKLWDIWKDTIVYTHYLTNIKRFRNNVYISDVCLYWFVPTSSSSEIIGVVLVRKWT